MTACSTPFERNAEHNAEGATPYHDIMSVNECADLCRTLAKCIAFDYDRNLPPYKNSRCWIHDDASIVMKEQPAVDHYVKGPLVCTAGNSKTLIFTAVCSCFQIITILLALI